LSVLPEHQDVGERAHAAADIAERDAGGPFAVRPQVGASRARAERQRLVDDSHLRVDLERARLHRHRARLLRRPRVPVDDHRAHAAARQLIGEHEPGRAGAHDQDFPVHVG
jgi:hypothetical protein